MFTTVTAAAAALACSGSSWLARPLSPWRLLPEMLILALLYSAGLRALRIGGHHADIAGIALAAATAWHVPPGAAVTAPGCTCRIAGDELTRGSSPLPWPVTRREFYPLPRPRRSPPAGPPSGRPFPRCSWCCWPWPSPATPASCIISATTVPAPRPADPDAPHRRTAWHGRRRRRPRPRIRGRAIGKGNPIMTVRRLTLTTGQDGAQPSAASAAGPGSQRPRYPCGWAAANQRRVETATVTSAESVGRALQVLDGNVAPHVLEAALLRIAEPGLALSALAGIAGCTKHVLAGRLRRLVKAAERAAAGTAAGDGPAGWAEREAPAAAS